ncbi:MAG: hypothetical protein M3Y27_17825 [Acidobacteriota bacterium]|nr:hypothetical protein [Acidobacteriota bacterium]
MSRILCCCAFLVSPLLVIQVCAQPAGVTTEWDARKMLEALTLQTQHFKSVIGRVQPGGWVANGAPQTYVAQWTTAQNETNYLLGSIDALAKQPERLPLALDAYFRMQAMESTFVSVIEGIRKYQNPAIADLLQGVVNENSTNRDRLRQFLTDLATQKEQEFQVVDKEAQRCRGVLMKERHK